MVIYYRIKLDVFNFFSQRQQAYNFKKTSPLNMTFPAFYRHSWGCWIRLLDECQKWKNNEKKKKKERKFNNIIILRSNKTKRVSSPEVFNLCLVRWVEKRVPINTLSGRWWVCGLRERRRERGRFNFYGGGGMPEERHK